MNVRIRIGIVLLCAVVALLAGAVSAIGVLSRGDESFEEVVSVRGERYPMATTGVYAFNAERVVAEGVGWDLFTLIFAVPALLLALRPLARGSLPARLFAVGILTYLLYQYLMYSVAWALGPLLIPFIAIYGLSLCGIALIVSTIPISNLPLHFSGSFPRKGMAMLSLAMGTLLLLMWLKLILSTMGNDVEGVLMGQTTLVVQALDLGLIVPLTIFTGITAWRGSAVGYLLSTAVVVKAFAMASAICAMLLSAWAYEGTLEVVPFVIFGSAAAISLWLGIAMYRSFSAEPKLAS